MRLDAEHGKRWRPTLLRTGVALAFIFAAACTKSWVLGQDPGAGGAGGPAGAAGGSGATGGTPLPVGTGGFTSPGTGGFTGDHPGTGGKGATCSTTKIFSDVPKTNMVLLVGRDASMATRLSGPGNDTSRMIAVQSQLKTLLEANQNAINFGYLGLPSLVACPNDMACCTNSTQDAYMPPQDAAALTITGMLTSCPPGMSMPGCTSSNDARPIAEALQAADDIFSGSPPYGDNSLILIVDGPPGCPTDDPATKCAAEIKAVASLHNDPVKSIKTYVIAIGDDAQNDSCLQQIAKSGAAMLPSQVDDVGSLNAALTGAMAKALAAACTVEVAQNGYGPALSVRLSDQNQDLQVPFIDANQQDGWTFLTPMNYTRLRIVGMYCEMLQKSASLDVVVKGGCPPCLASQPNGCQ